MSEFYCGTCQKTFATKAQATSHQKRKTPCQRPSEYSDKPLPELKALCKEKGIKGMTGKSKADLIALLSTPTNLVIVPEEPVVPAYNTIVLGDCLEQMKGLAPNSVDMICTDPPYFLDGLGDTWNKEALDKKGSSKTVGNLPKGMKFDRNQSKNFHAFYTKVAAEAFRVLKPGGAFLSFSSPRLYHAMAWAIEEAGFEIRDMLGWIYTQSQVKAFSQDHIIDKDKTKTEEEKTALKALCSNWKTPQLKPAIEPICLAVKPIEGRYIDNFQAYGTGLMNTSDETKTGDGYFPSNILITQEDIGQGLEKVFLVPKPTKKEKGEYNSHLSVKPVQLISHLIRLFTKEDALILDPFLGSGTTAIAAVQTKRRYLGYDINPEYLAIAKRRLEEAI